MKQSESGEQQALMEWARRIEGRCPELKYMYHVPNEGKRSQAYGGRLKAEGMRNGVPDLCLPSAHGQYHGMYIEMKVGKNTPTPEQRDYIEYLRGAGYYAVVCYGFEAAVEELKKYLNLTNCVKSGAEVKKMEGLNGKVAFRSGEYRPCIIDEKIKAIFHRWEYWSEVIPPSPMVGGHTGEPIKGVVGVVELGNGQIEKVLPNQIRFTSDPEIF